MHCNRLPLYIFIASNYYHKGTNFASNIGFTIILSWTLHTYLSCNFPVNCGIEEFFKAVIKYQAFQSRALSATEVLRCKDRTATLHRALIDYISEGSVSHINDVWPIFSLSPAVSSKIFMHMLNTCCRMHAQKNSINNHHFLTPLIFSLALHCWQCSLILFAFQAEWII